MSDLFKKLRILLFNPKYTKDQVLAYIKTEMNPGDFESAINSNPLLKKTKLRNDKFANVESFIHRDTYIFTRDLRREIFWLLYNIKEEADIINKFILEKKLFEEAFILENYVFARNQLNSMRELLGESIWTIEMSLLLDEYEYNTKENWESLSEYLKKVNSAFYQFVINIYSKRIEENMSFENFYSQFQIDFDSVQAEPIVKDFLVFKSVFNANYEYAYKTLEGVLYVLNIFGVIDQYQTLVEALLHLTAVDKTNDSLIANFLNKIGDRIFEDPKLINISNLLNKDGNCTILKDSKTVLPIIDEYTKGNFEQSRISSSENISKYPLVFELYEIYAKSLIHMGLEFTPLNISSTIDNILESVYKTLLFNKESEKYRNKLLKISLTFLSFDFGKQISSFALSISRDFYSNHNSIMGCLSSSINNPRMLSLNLSGRDKKQIYNNLILRESVSFKINLFINGQTVEVKDIVKNNFQRDVYLAKNLFETGDFEKVILTTEKYLNNLEIPFYYDNILFLLYESYQKTDRLIDAIQLYASILADNEFFLYQFDANELSKKIIEIGPENFAEYIDLPILFSTVSKDYDLYESYIEFMAFNETEYPSRLKIAELISKFSLNKVIYFLQEVCKISTIRYSLEFSSIESAEQERHAICDLLKEIDPKNSLNYDREISDLLRIGAVRKVIKEVDEGRLYVNIENLKNQQLSNLKESFTRYKEIEYISKEKGLIGFNSSKERNWIKVNIHQKQAYSELDDPAYLAFKSIYVESKERFLFSKEYGLDSSLSTRIRHGALKNHIRSVFEKLNLVTSKADNVYIDNLKWQDLLSHDPELNYRVQNLLKSFSKKIDDYTTYIVNNLIQIKNERHPENKDGLFNYYSDDEILWPFYQEYKERFDSVDAILDVVYNDLINYTLRSICIGIYDFFVYDINEKYQELIEELQLELRELDLGNYFGLLPNVIKSSTDIQAELEVIAQWFTLTTTSSSSLLDIETIINASIELTNKINPNFCLRPEIINNCDPVIGYNDLIFVFNILLNNIIQHSNLQPHEVNVSINLEQLGKYFIVTFKNNICSSVNYDRNKQKLELVKQNWNNHDDIERSNTEGESGYDKIKRLLLYEAQAKTDMFDYIFGKDEVRISLYFPYNKPITNEESSDN